MHVKLITDVTATLSGEVLFVPVFTGQKQMPDALVFLQDHISPPLDSPRLRARLEGKLGQKVAVHTAHPDFPLLVLVGAGAVSEWDLEKARELWGHFIRFANEFREKTLTVYWDQQLPLPAEPALFFTETVAALHLANYRVTHFLTDRTDLPPEIEQVNLLYPAAPSAMERWIETGEKLGKSVNLARQLAEFPANYLTPEKFVDRVRELGESHGWQLEIFDVNQLRKMGMGALLAVAQGSENPPYLVIARYEQPAADTKVALIGKGVTFDSGGISIKPSRDMHEMKYDMGGAAAVLGSLLAVSLNRLPVNVIAALPLVENMPSGKAMRPGDIVTSYCGKTIEIADTDAEGRLILADTLSYVEKIYQPDYMIDLATLTGSVVSALGHLAAGSLTRDHHLQDQLLRASDISGEKIWPLPLWKEYQEMMKSKIADIRNISTRPGAGVVTAGIFLKYFVEKTPWLHLDIAGTAYGMPEKSYRPEGATGFGVRLLWHWLHQISEEPERE